MVGVGAHGYDFLVGTWSCVNNAPSAIGGPKSTTLTFARSSDNSAVFARVTGKNFDGSSYITYAAKTKRWSNPSLYPDGSYQNESTTDTGKKTVWTGPYVNGASGKTTQTRDTYVMISPTKYTDVGQSLAGGVWKTQYKITCTKS
jgi:hypothetical protein